MKALILAGGKGTRLRPITFSMAKQLVPVANKPVIEYGIEAIAEAGVKEFGIIVADAAEAIKEVCGDGSRWGISIEYISQPDPLGLAHAVKTAQPFLGDSDFIMYLGDNLIKSSVSGLVREFETHRPAATILLTAVPNPSDFGVAEMVDGKVFRLEEKPKEPKSNLALVGVYLFDRRIHDVISTLQPSRRGEYEITDAIQGLIDRGLDVRSHIVEGWWKDTGTVEAMLEANRLILEDIEATNQGEVEDSKIEGRVAIGPGTLVRNSVVRGPAIIGANCLIEDSFVGPFTAIDNGTNLVKTEVEHSIILSDCRIVEVSARIEGSLIGRGVEIGPTRGPAKTIQMVLGDSSAVRLSG
ncbi:MAG TPA: glucose-1-phosphate thymidylyltransferase [Fimbriimonadaceae bacterium]|nr:glucose-1-phosphate thymidylyltransferase [Fimbriimonadaceae bacterium]